MNNNLSEEDIKSRSAMLGESFAGDAKKAIDIYKKNTAQYRAFDYIRQVAVFSYLYQNTDCFKDVDYLIVDDAKALMNYIMSCHGNQKEYLGYRLKEFQAHLEKIIDENNGIKITKDCGLFICRK